VGVVGEPALRLAGRRRPASRSLLSKRALALLRLADAGVSIWPEPATHREWIAHRARAQFDAGLIDEARTLRDRFDPALPAFSAIGYREAWAVIDGRLDRDQAIAEDARRNVAFAKRQRTWFRAEPDVTWLDATASPADRALAAAMTIAL